MTHKKIKSTQLINYFQLFLVLKT